MQEYKKVSPI